MSLVQRRTPALGPNPPLPAMAEAFQAWLDGNASELAPFKQEPAAFDEKLVLLRALQARVFDEGWARYGWPESFGGLGGDIRHRALFNDLLEQNGFPPRHVFEHLEVLLPALERYGTPAQLEALFLPTLRGDLLWCQGFSEPTAGSDLAALKCRATRTSGGYRIDGHKLWTSWAKWATHLMFLARTGTPDERHRGLTIFVTPIDVPGIEVHAIRQGNGHDELAEVFFDGALLPEDRRLGSEGEGWAVAMHILAGERGSYTWLRQAEMLPRLEQLAGRPGAGDHLAALGDSLLELLALRCRARSVVEILAAGRAPGPESSVTKVLAIEAEQGFYAVVREVLNGGLELATDPDWHFWQEHYLYSRAASVFGGSQQIQYNVIAKLLISQGGEQQERDDDSAAVRASVVEAIEQSESGRAAMRGLDWWSFAAAPEDGFGRAAFAAWFEAEGRACGTSPALAGVRGRAVAAALAVAPDAVAMGLRRGREVLAYGLDAATRWLAVEDGDGKLELFPAEDLSVAASNALDARLVTRVLGPSGGRTVQVDPAAHARALDLARIAAAHEILGAATALLDAAIAHTNEREQFGQPISRFQAIQHILAQMQVALSALAHTCTAALEQWSAGDARDIARVAKAVAGRSGVVIAQHALQCFGAIGFTDGHVHPLHQKRILVLDMLLGSSFDLRRELAKALVETGRAPRCVQIWRAGDERIQPS